MRHRAEPEHDEHVPHRCSCPWCGHAEADSPDKHLVVCGECGVDSIGWPGDWLFHKDGRLIRKEVAQ